MGWRRRLAAGLGFVGLSVFGLSLDCAGRLGREVCGERLAHTEFFVALTIAMTRIVLLLSVREDGWSGLAAS